LRGQIKAPRCGITWIYHRQLLSSPGYTPDVCGLFIKTHKNKLVECFNAYGVVKGSYHPVVEFQRLVGSKSIKV